jgi:hypothetical protein
VTQIAQIGNTGDPRAGDPAHHAVTVTPSNTDDLPAASTAIFVGGAGSVKVTMLGGEILTFNNVPVGWHPIRVTRIWTSTTATNIVAVWR